MSETNEGQSGPNSLEVVKNAALFASEAVVPGGSNLASGNVKTGLIYAAAGMAAKAILGFPAWVLVSADSFAKATTGNHLTELARSGRQRSEAEDPRIADLQAKVAALEARLATDSGTTTRGTAGRPK